VIDDASNMVSMLDYYSNNIAFVRAESLLSGSYRYFLHAPTDVSFLNVFASTNLLGNRGGWMWPSKVNHDADPLIGIVGSIPEVPTFLTADNAAIDSDGDGLPDCMEIRIFGTDPTLADTDGDGLLDGEEVLRYGCSPLLASTDGSGMTDGQKIALGLNPNVSDTDGDGLSDYDEVNKYFTDPKNPDTDSDGTMDGAEIQAGTYPRYSDTDGDGLSDTVEITIGTNPLLADTDGDGIDDQYEHQTTSFNPMVSSDALDDNDNDGISNLLEYRWLYYPNYSIGHDWIQKLVLVPAGINGIRVSSADQYKIFAPGNWASPAKLWIRPLRDSSTTNLVPQLLYHTQTPGFFINGTDASGVSSPITIPAVNSNTEFIITSSSSAWGTNIVFRLAKTNGSVSCTAYAYSPKLTKSLFFTELSNSTNVNFGATGTLYVCMSDSSNKPPVFINPTQYPDGGLGFPYYTFNDWLLYSVDGSGCSYTTNTLNCHDYRSAYGDIYGYRTTTGMKFDPGKYTIKVGFDMNGNGVLDNDEINESCKVTVVNASMSRDPRDIAAETDWTGIENILQRSTVTVDIQPTNVQQDVIETTTVVVSRVSSGSYNPGQGTLVRDSTNHTKWGYTPFAEAKTEKHPTAKEVYIVPKFNGKVCGNEIYVRVNTVFQLLTVGYSSGGQYHTPTEDDYNSAWQYAKWKYNIVTTGLTSIAYDANQIKRGLTFTPTGDCTLGHSAFENENWCASTMGHEEIHGVQGYWYCFYHQFRGSDHFDVPAYQWEIDNASNTGISTSEIQTATQWRDYYSGVSDVKPSQD